MNRYRLGWIAFACVCACVAAARAELPPETAKLLATFEANYRNPNTADPKWVADLAAAPDADLAFFESVIAHRNEHDHRFLKALEQLAQLDTPRTFDRAAAMLDAPDSQDKTLALEIFARWHRPEVIPKLLAGLAPENKPWERRAAVDALAEYDDPRIDPALIKLLDGDPGVAFAARAALARHRYPPAFDAILKRMLSAPEGELDAAIADVAAYRNANAVPWLLVELRKLDGSKNEHLRSWTIARLREVLADAQPLLGPWPDDVSWQWDDFWRQAQPLLNDDLTLKSSSAATTRPAAATDFAANLGRVSLAASVDRATYRVGDPIQIRLTLTNAGGQPVRTIPPRVPSGWWPTMAYGVRLARDGGTVLLDLPPSDFYEGSYSGAPAFETVAANASFESATCLQGWLRPNIELPLAAGEYELTVTFDAAKFPGANGRGVNLLGRWTAPAVRFKVDGAALTDPEAIAGEIGRIVGLKYLRSDLVSTHGERSRAAWDALFTYGDSRLAEFVRTVGLAGPSSRPAFEPERLRPYASPGRAPFWR